MNNYLIDPTAITQEFLTFLQGERDVAVYNGMLLIDENKRSLILTMLDGFGLEENETSRTNVECLLNLSYRVKERVAVEVAPPQNTLPDTTVQRALTQFLTNVRSWSLDVSGITFDPLFGLNPIRESADDIRIVIGWPSGNWAASDSESENMFGRLGALDSRLSELLYNGRVAAGIVKIGNGADVYVPIRPEEHGSGFSSHYAKDYTKILIGLARSWLAREIREDPTRRDLSFANMKEEFIRKVCAMQKGRNDQALEQKRTIERQMAEQTSTISSLKLSVNQMRPLVEFYTNSRNQQKQTLEAKFLEIMNNSDHEFISLDEGQFKFKLKPVELVYKGPVDVKKTFNFILVFHPRSGRYSVTQEYDRTDSMHPLASRRNYQADMRRVHESIMEAWTNMDVSEIVELTYACITSPDPDDARWNNIEVV